MTPVITLEPTELQSAAYKAIRKAKDSLVNCTLIGLADKTGNPRVMQDPVIAQLVEDVWTESLKVLIPRHVGEIANEVTK